MRLERAPQVIDGGAQSMYPGHTPLDWLAECAGPYLPEMLAPATREGALAAIGRGPGDNGEQRRRQPLARMASADPALDAVYRYWRSCRVDGLLPRSMQVEMGRLAPAEGHVALVSVSGARPRGHGFPDGTIAWLGTPLYEDVLRCASSEPGYGRLVLPLAEDGWHVDMLAVCTSARA